MINIALMKVNVSLFISMERYKINPRRIRINSNLSRLDKYRDLSLEKKKNKNIETLSVLFFIFYSKLISDNILKKT